MRSPTCFLLWYSWRRFIPISRSRQFIRKVPRLTFQLRRKRRKRPVSLVQPAKCRQWKPVRPLQVQTTITALATRLVKTEVTTAPTTMMMQMTRANCGSRCDEMIPCRKLSSLPVRWLVGWCDSMVISLELFLPRVHRNQHNACEAWNLEMGFRGCCSTAD